MSMRGFVLLKDKPSHMFVFVNVGLPSYLWYDGTKRTFVHDVRSHWQVIRGSTNGTKGSFGRLGKRVYKHRNSVGLVTGCVRL